MFGYHYDSWQPRSSQRPSPNPPRPLRPLFSTKIPPLGFDPAELKKKKIWGKDYFGDLTDSPEHKRSFEHPDLILAQSSVDIRSSENYVPRPVSYLPHLTPTMKQCKH